jgi:hypothetical protein
MEALTHVIPTYIVINDSNLPRLVALTPEGLPDMANEEYNDVVENTGIVGIELLERKQFNVLVRTSSLPKPVWMPITTLVDAQLEENFTSLDNIRLQFVYDVKDHKVKIMTANKSADILSEAHLRMNPQYQTMFEWHKQPIGTECKFLIGTEPVQVLAEVTDQGLKFKSSGRYHRITEVNYIDGLEDLLSLQPVIPLALSQNIRDLDWEAYQLLRDNIGYYTAMLPVDLDRMPEGPVREGSDFRMPGILTSKPPIAALGEQYVFDLSKVCYPYTVLMHPQLVLNNQVLTPFSTPEDLRTTIPIHVSANYSFVAMPDVDSQYTQISSSKMRFVEIKVSYNHGVSSWKYIICPLKHNSKADLKYESMELQGTPGDTHHQVFRQILKKFAKRMNVHETLVYMCVKLHSMKVREESLNSRRFENRGQVIDNLFIPFIQG